MLQPPTSESLKVAVCAPRRVSNTRRNISHNSHARCLTCSWYVPDSAASGPASTAPEAHFHHSRARCLTCRWYVPDSAASAPASSAMMLKQVAATAGGVEG